MPALSASSGVRTGTAASDSFSYTHSAGTGNPGLLATAGKRRGGATITSMTYAGTGLVPTVQVVQGSDRAEVWEWDTASNGAPPTGSNTFVFTASLTGPFAFEVHSLQECDQTTPSGVTATAVTASGSSLTPSLTGETASSITFTSYTVDADRTGESSYGGGTINYDVAAGGRMFGSEEEDTGTDGQSCTWTTATAAAGCAAEFLHEAVAAGTTPKGPLGLPLHGPFAGPIGP